jgi:hypothetical protein
MSLYVIDTSVAVKWVVPEPDSPQALAFQEMSGTAFMTSSHPMPSLRKWLMFSRSQNAGRSFR